LGGLGGGGGEVGLGGWGEVGGRGGGEVGWGWGDWGGGKRGFVGGFAVESCESVGVRAVCVDAVAQSHLDAS
jgi:hypothetical protein